MLGKLLGSAGVSLTTMAVYLGGGAPGCCTTTAMASVLRQGLLAAFLVFQVLGVLMYGSVFVAVGAACSDLKEAQNYLLPVMMVLVFPLMIWWKVLEEPTSGFATVAVVRAAVDADADAVAAGRHRGGAAVATDRGAAGHPGHGRARWCGRAAASSGSGLLLQGKPPRPTQLLRWILRG